jgi:hypothetical protein
VRLAHGLSAVREALGGFIAMKGTLDLKVTRVPEAVDLALETGVWSFTGTGPDDEPVKLAAQCANVLRRQGGRLLPLRDRQPLGNGLKTRVGQRQLAGNHVTGYLPWVALEDPDGHFLINTDLDSAAAPMTLLMNWNPRQRSRRSHGG